MEKMEQFQQTIASNEKIVDENSVYNGKTLAFKEISVVALELSKALYELVLNSNATQDELFAEAGFQILSPSNSESTIYDEKYSEILGIENVIVKVGHDYSILCPISYVPNILLANAQNLIDMNFSEPPMDAIMHWQAAQSEIEKVKRLINPELKIEKNQNVDF